MTTSVPASIAWPALALFLLAIMLRMLWHNTAQLDVYANIMLYWTAIIQVLSDPVAERWIAARTPIGETMVQQAALFMILLGHAEFLGVAEILRGADADEVKRSHIWHRAAAFALIAVMFIAGYRARVEGQRLEVAGGWDGVAVWAAFCVLPVCSARALILLIRQDLSDGIRSLRHLLVLMEFGIAAIIVGGNTVAMFVLAALEELGMAHTVPMRVSANSSGFFGVLVVLTALAFGSCASDIAALIGMDRRGKTDRNLRPLWSVLTTEFPEVVMPGHRSSGLRRITKYQLHRTTTEIRDSIIRLLPFIRELGDDDQAWLSSVCAPASSESEPARRSLQLARALAARRAGDSPVYGSEAASARSSARNQADDAAELLRLAKWWPKANGHVEGTQSKPKDTQPRKAADIS